MVAVMAALLLGAANASKPSAFETGFCSGLAWIDLKPGEKVVVENGPDFVVYRVHGPGDAWWGVYSGFAAQIRGSDPLLFSRNGVTVRGDTTGGNFRGYLAQNARGSQNHFFGAVFGGNRLDLGFFNRVDFGPKGQERCSHARH